MNPTTRKNLIEFWQAGVNAVSGKQSVATALSQDEPFQPDLIIAVGKAASGMCLGALESLPQPCPAIVVTKYHHTDAALKAYDNVEIIESAHPVPDQNSLLGGSRMLEAVAKQPSDAKLLLLVSGGASALSECLPEDISLEDLQAMNDDMLSSGKDIGYINAKRKEISLLKDGKLLQAFTGSIARVYAISDVEGDSINTIGSGTGDCHRATCEASSRVIASNQIARQQVVDVVKQAGYPVIINEESLYDDVFSLAPRIADTLKAGEPGIYIWGGEPTIHLPKNPGEGGRNQSLALALAKEISGLNHISILVAGTDGSDGPTDAAGGVIDGQTFADKETADQALATADAGSYLREAEDIFISGPTNTNVMDLVIALVV